MKYRFRMADKPPSHRKKNRPLRLKGRDTLRKKPLFPEPIEPIDFFEFAEEEPPRRRKRERKGTLKTLFSQLQKRLAATAKAIRHSARTLLQKLRRPKKAKRIRTLPILSGALCAALLVTACSAGTVLLALFSRYGRAYTVCRIPDFLGKTPDSVLAETDQLPLNLIISYEYNPDVMAGLVISQTPKAGVTRRIYGSDGTCTVSLVVSRHREPYTLAHLAGISERDACLQLRNAGLSAIVTRAYSDTAPKGTVLSSTPEAGSSLREGDTVTLCVSLGKQTLRLAVPDLFGKSEADAAARLRAAGLSMGSISYVSSAYPAGTVIAQTPAAHTSLEEGSSVSVTVSAGDRYAIRTVPDLYGMNTEQAAAKLREYGLVVGESYPIANASPKGTVIAQSPVAGAPITSALVEVHLYISS